MFPELMLSSSIQDFNEQHLDKSNLSRRAVDLYSSMFMHGKLMEALHSLFRRPSRLLDLQSLKYDARVSGRHYVGIQDVPIERIRGSEGRVSDFDISFFPINPRLRSRWMSVASARMAGLPLPPVELIQVGEIYFVRDGHHRISVAKALGEKYIEAEVILWDVKTLNLDVRASFNTLRADAAFQCV